VRDRAIAAPSVQGQDVLVDLTEPRLTKTADGTHEILVSSTVKDLVAGSGLVFEKVGAHELKGVPDRWRLFRVTS
jgi:class 3 adenylate cyclase